MSTRAADTIVRSFTVSELERVLAITKDHLGGTITVEAMLVLVDSMRRINTDGKLTDPSIPDEIPIQEFLRQARLPSRVEKVIEKTGVATVNQLLEMRMSAFTALHNFGDQSRKQLDEALWRLYRRTLSP